MDKLKPPAKNDMFDERLAKIEALVNKIVDHINDQIVTEAVAEIEEPNGD